MQEISPGLWHWSARHPNIGSQVSSYYLVQERVVLDPILPDEGREWFAPHPPKHVLLSNRHHSRHAFRLQEEFGAEVHCVSNGVYELEGRGRVTPYEFGDELPGGVHAHEVDAICPDETALYIPAHRALACADGVIRRGGGELMFVPDQLMDDPPATRAGLASAYRRLLELEFDHLLLAHGEPVVGAGHQALAAFVDGAERA